MERFSSLVDHWVFDYMIYKYVANYSGRTGMLQVRFESGRQSAIIKDLIHEGLDHMPPNRKKVHLLLLVFIMQEIEEISCGRKEADSGDDEDDVEVESRSDLSMKDCNDILIHLKDLQKSLSVFWNELERESLRNLARKCLVDSMVMLFQYSLKVGSGERETLEILEKLVRESGTTEEEECYQFCRNLKPISGKFRPISGFISSMKELISMINSCFEIPDLIQFAISRVEDSTVALQYLLQDQRPCRKADVMDLSLGLTDGRKQELDELIARTQEDNIPAGVEVEQRTPLSSSSKSQRKWDGWQRTQFSPVHSTSRIQEEQSASSSTVPSTSRIPEKPRVPSSTMPTTSRIQEQTEVSVTRPSTSNSERSSNFRPQRDQAGLSYVAALGKRLREFNVEDHRMKLRVIDTRMKKTKKNLGPPSHQIVRLGAWLPEEETKFIEETLKIGVGNWAAIKDVLGTARSSQQLKDKWRNIRRNQIQEVAKRLNIDMREVDNAPK